MNELKVTVVIAVDDDDDDARQAKTVIETQGALQDNALFIGDSEFTVILASLD